MAARTSWDSRFSIDGQDVTDSSDLRFQVGTTVSITYILTNMVNQASMWSAEVTDPNATNGLQSTDGRWLDHNAPMRCTTTVIVKPGRTSIAVVGNAWSNNRPKLSACVRYHLIGLA